MKNIVALSCLVLLTIPLFSFSQCPAAPGGGCDGSGTSLDLYWVGTDSDHNGDWNSPCSWRVGSTMGVEPCQAPRSIDNINFDGSSFAGGVAAATITVTSQARCNNLLVAPSVNSVVLTPTFSLQNPGFIEIYGDFTLQNNIAWNTVGGPNSGPELFFKATSVGKTIQTSGHIIGSIVFDGIGGEWSLQDNLVAGSVNFIFGYLNTTDGTTSFDMDLDSFKSSITSGASSANRRVDLNNSEVTIDNGSVRYGWSVWDARYNTTANFNFNVGTSKLVFTGNPFIHFGAGLTYNVINHTNTGQIYIHFGSYIADTLETNGYIRNYHTTNLNVLKINSISKTHRFYTGITVNTDLIVSGNLCEPTVFYGDNGVDVLNIPASVSADPMNGFYMDNIQCNDGTAGHLVNGYGIGNTNGWIIIPPASRDLYWVGNTNSNWSEPTNWSTSSTGSPLLAASDCPPTQEDNVFFISPLADGDNIILDQEAFCNDQTWNITSPATLSGGNVMNVHGNLQFDADMNLTSSSSFRFKGTVSNHTIFSAGKVFPSTVYFRENSLYTLLDDLNFNNLYFYQQDGFVSNGHNLTGIRFYIRHGNQDFSGSTITLSGSTPWYIASSQGVTTYDASSHVIFTSSAATTLISGWGWNLKFPNFTLQSPNTRLSFRSHLNGGSNIVFEGDVTFNGSATFYREVLLTSSDLPPGNLAQFVVNGNLTLNSGSIYEFGLNTTGAVSGNLVALGDCSNPITIRGINGSSFGMNISGTTTMDFCNIADMNSTTSINATNSFDLGNTTNVTFTTGTSQTYYWRALAGSCPGCNYNGDWNSSMGYWTTNPANVEGIPGCIPGPEDDVVFDNMSFSVGISTISLNSLVSCRNITVIASNVQLIGSSSLIVTGSFISDATLTASGFTGNLEFNSTIANTIDLGGISLACDVLFTNSAGTWSLQNNKLETTKIISLIGGTVNTNGQLLQMRRFFSNNSNTRALNLGNSIVNVTGSGNFATIGGSSNIYAWDSDNMANFTFSSGTSTINFINSLEPVLRSGPIDFYHVNFTSSLASTSVSPVIIGNGMDTEYMKFDCSARFYGSHAYDTLEFTPGNVYSLEAGSTQTLNAPNGILIATGNAGNFIAINSITTGVLATFHKDNTGGSTSSFCFDYVAVEDNQATSNDPVFSFFTGLNSNNISASGIWDFTRPIFIAPSITSSADQFMCSAGSSVQISWDLDGSGPYTLTYTANGANPVTVTMPNGTPTYSVTVTPAVDTEYEVTIFSADNCGTPTAGTIIDNNMWVYVPTPSPIAQFGDTSICVLNNENTLFHFHDNITERPIVSVSDDATGAGMGVITTTIEIDPSVQYLGGIPYLQRRFGIEPTVNESGKVRLYFTQAELDALSIEWGLPLTAGDLLVTKYSNNSMDFTGAAVLLTPTITGNIPAGITTTSNVLFVEVSVSSFSHFVLHPPTLYPLPVELISFDAVPTMQNEVICAWVTASENNCSHFQIEKSNNGVSWEKINTIVQGAGNSTDERTYDLVDRKPFLGISYYKLVQYDFDGNNKTYGPVSVKLLSPLDILIYPNPTDGNSTIRLSSERNRQLILHVTNSLGQLIELMNLNVIEGENTYILNSKDYAPGVYFISINDEKKTNNNRFKLVVK